MSSIDFVIGLLPQFVHPFFVTISLWIISNVIGLAFAILVALMAASSLALLRVPAKMFITSIRGTPLLVQVYIAYYGFGSLFVHIPGIRKSLIWPILQNAYWYALFALIISCAAYSGEILRGAILGVPKGEVEAAKSLGLSKRHILRHIVLPRAFHISLPALGGESIILLKSTVLASTITVMDLLGMANYIGTQTFRVYEPLLTVAVVYVILTLFLSRALRFLERKAQYST